MNDTHSTPPKQGLDSDQRATQWLSHGFEELIQARQSDSARDGTKADYAVVIVGSGYGGAVAAAELAAHRAPNQKVCVLERGREYLQGSFPSRMSDLAKHVRFTGPRASKPSGYREGLFDVRVGKDVSTVLANGVGGGSLINAGVMVMPESSVLLDAAWPEDMRNQAAVDELLQCSEHLRARLGATHAIDDKDIKDPRPHKFEALRQIASGHTFKSVPITIALTDDINTSAGLKMHKCVRCGDCATGCNHNAKLSLDVTLLAEAVQFGAEIYAGATLLRINKQLRPNQPPLWRLHLVHTDAALRRRQNQPFVLLADHVVLSAGTLGSTEILMRSECEDLQFSNRLGHQFSANGDLIAAAYSTDAVANCAGDETSEPDQVPKANRVGPTITGLVDLRSDKQMVIEDLGVPGPLSRLFEEVLTTTAALHLLGESDEAPHDPESSSSDPCPVDPDQIKKSLLVVMMSRDPADGVLSLKGSHSHDAGDGAIAVHWPRLRDHPPFLDHHQVLQALLDRSPVRGRVLPYPIWRPLPDKLDYLLAGKNGPLVTVHPLGGCPMGSTPMNGVVDHLGRVFDRSSPGNPTHEGLAVLDGSIIPTSLGINPALTIASVALRAVTSLRQEWGFTHKAQSNQLSPRPIFRIPQVLEHPRPSEIEVLERLSGCLPLRGFERDAHVELTMRFEPIEVHKLSVPGARLNLPAAGGKLRIFSKPPRDDVEAKDERALLVATVSGSLRIFHREHSTPLQRRLRGLWAWFRNRGLRDSVLWLLDYIKNDAMPTGATHGFFGQVVERLRGAWRLGSRAGAVRLMEYDLIVQEILRQQPRLPGHGDDFKGKVIRGCKRLTYSRRANPWRQLMEVSLQEFPALAPMPMPAAPILKLDTGFLARQGVPLMRVVGQQDQPAALVDLSSLALYLLRMLLHVHVWSFRAPDAPKAREIRRLPGSVPGLPAPVCVELPVDVLADGRPVMVRLTHYRFGQQQRERAVQRQPDAEQAIRTPVLMIHGYSASGTTFAHHAVRPNLASALWDEGRDVWIVDMRTSAGMPHARHPWSFEEVARADIPVAIHHVLSITGSTHIDVFAHCMGSAMLGMALLGPRHNDERFWPLRDKLHQKIRCLAMSQVAPAMVFTPANVFRAYAMRFFKHYLPTGHYEFRTSGDPGLADQLLDRLLATLPYPEAEFDRENPLWTPWRRTPWAGTRHRMDALYGRDFSLNNMPQGVLDHIDDHFGPLSIETVSQAIHFARFRTITNHRGFNEFLNPHRLRECYDFPMLSVHGEDNGLVSVRTLMHFRRALNDAGAPGLRRALFEGFGHQDCLIGVGADQVFRKVIAFYNSVPPRPPVGQAAKTLPLRPVFSSQVPAFGLRWDPAAQPLRISFSAGDHGGRGRPLLGIFVPVVWKERLYLVPRVGEPVEPSKAAFIELVKVSSPHPIDELDENTRVRFTFDRFNLPKKADGLLVMLMYLQSFDIGGDPRMLDIDMVTLKEAADLLGDSLPVELRSSPALAAPKDVATLPGFPGEGLERLIQVLVNAMGQSVHRAYTESSPATLKLGMLRPPPEPLKNIQQPPVLVRSFALASCQYPGGMLDRTPRGTPEERLHGPSDASYMRLAARLEDPQGPAPSFLILAGDQVYVDATAGLFDPKTLDDQFRLPYENFLGSRGPRSVLCRLPAYMVPDDHEIDDNWEPDPPGARRRRPLSNQVLMERGVQAFLHHQRDTAAPLGRTAVLWLDKPIDGFPFFLADSRTDRSPRTVANVNDADLFGEKQAAAIDEWLRSLAIQGPRFLVTGCMVLPRSLRTLAGQASSLRSDAWDGYPRTLHHLLAGVFERGRDDVIFLSGDAHLGNVTKIVLTKAGNSKKVVAHSIHCPALYAPYPFANAVKEDFAQAECFAFTGVDPLRGAETYGCSVETWFPTPGDGFVVLNVVEDERRWSVTVEFDTFSIPCDSGDTVFNFEISKS